MADGDEVIKVSPAEEVLVSFAPTMTDVKVLPSLTNVEVKEDSTSLLDEKEAVLDEPSVGCKMNEELVSVPFVAGRVLPSETLVLELGSDVTMVEVGESPPEVGLFEVGSGPVEMLVWLVPVSSGREVG